MIESEIHHAVPTPGFRFAQPGSSAAIPASNRRLWWTLVSISVACDFLVLPVVSSFPSGPTVLQAVPIFAMFGCTLAQGSLLAAWLVWGDLPFRRRLLWHWIIAGGLCALWLLGLFLAAPRRNFQEVGFTVALTVPIISLGAQLPFWAARLFFGWRLVRSDAAIAVDQPLSIRDLFIATLVVAASFALARLSPAAQEEPDFKIAWGLFMSAAATISFVTIAPAAALLLRPGPFSRGIKLSLGYAAMFIAIEWLCVVIARATGIVNLPPRFLFAGLSGMILAYANTAILAAAVAREHGYLLTWGRQPTIYSVDLAALPAAEALPAGSID